MKKTKAPVWVTLAIILWAASTPALYAEPPHPEVAAHNDALASSLPGQSLPLGWAKPWQHPLESFDIQVHTAYPSVDGTVSSAHPPRVLWGWTYRAQTYYDWQGSNTACDSARWRMSLAGITSSFTAHASLDGQTRNQADAPDPFAVPFSPDELAGARGPVTAWLDGAIVLHYYTDDEVRRCKYYCTPGGCVYQSWIEQSHRYLEYNYTATSTAASFNVSTPAHDTVQLDPWVANFSVFLPAFRTFAYTNTTLASLETRIDGEATGRKQFLGFDIQSDAKGAWTMSSVPNGTAWQNRTNPARISESASRAYAHAYRVDQAVNQLARTGRHDWQLEATDVFGDAFGTNGTHYSHDAARMQLTLSETEAAVGGAIDLEARVRHVDGRPVAGQTVRFESAAGRQQAVTDTQGRARTRISFSAPGAYRIVARFDGAEGLAPAFVDGIITVLDAPAQSQHPPARFDALFLGLLLVLGLAATKLH